MNKPIIGIAGSVLIDQSGAWPGYRRSYVNEDYVISVLKNGGVPFILPVQPDNEIINAQIEQIDGLILSGGHDVVPQNYNEEPQQKLEDCSPERDQFDFDLIKAATQKGIPILGICRGMQIINTYYGGSLYQDLSYRNEPTFRHMQGHSPSQVTHQITIEKNSKLASIISESQMMVNSFHHQVVKDVAKNFKIAARANDGVIEAIEPNDKSFILGIQWHPEMLHESKPEMNEKIFGSFIKNASERR